MIKGTERKGGRGAKNHEAPSSLDPGGASEKVTS